MGVPTAAITDSALAQRAPFRLFAAALATNLLLTHIGWDHTILDGDHGFRQTQTAISASYMIATGPSLAYQVPVFGPPWSVPFEFPLYQWLVAGIVRLFATPLDQTGRFVSLAFFYLCLVPANDLLRYVAVSRPARLLTLATLLLSPFYLFWSRTVLIESLALFFSLSYLALVLRFLKAPASARFFSLMAAGSIAAMVKITTFAPIWLAVVIITFCRFAGWYRSRAERPAVNAATPTPNRGGRLYPKLPAHRSWVALAATLVLPLLFGLAWTTYADSVKEQNAFARTLTSRALAEWNFGTFRQRLSVQTWLTILGRTNLAIGHAALIGAALLSAFAARRRRCQCLAALGLFLAAPLLFTNLHVVHEYYAYANNIFLIGMLGLAIAALLERGDPYRRCAYAMLGMTVVLSAVRFAGYYFPTQSHNSTELLRVASTLESSTRPTDLVMILGCDWSPEIPYYSHRRALMLPARQAALADIIALARITRPSALLVHQISSSASFDASIAGILDQLHLPRQPLDLGNGYRLFADRETEPRLLVHSRTPQLECTRCPARG